MEEKQYAVDYKQLKGRVGIAAVLDHFGVTGLRRAGDELKGACPVHRGSGESFKANTVKHGFQCFSPQCKAKGNQIDLSAALLKNREGREVTFHEAACYLAEAFKVGEPEPATGGKEHVAVKPVAEQGSGNGLVLGSLITELEQERAALESRLAQVNAYLTALHSAMRCMV